MKEFIRVCAEKIGIIEPVVAPVCDHLSDLLCQYTEGAYKLEDYLPNNLLKTSDSLLGWAYENPWGVTRHALSAVAIGFYLYNEAKQNKK